MASSFRDPAGRLIVDDTGVFRHVNPAGVENLEAFLHSRAIGVHLAAGRVVRTGIRLRSATDTVLEHERIPFVSFPQEWTPGMLYAAATLTLDLCEDLLPEGLGLKDATPLNVLFRGTQPVFVDVLSVEPRDPRDPIWLASGQFVRTFLLPLLLNRTKGLRLADTMLSRRDGIEVAEACRMLSWLERWRSPFLQLVTIPAMLNAQATANTGIYQPMRAAKPEQARYTLEQHYGGLRRQLRRAAPKPVSAGGAGSGWAAYGETQPSYSEEQLAVKRRFVGECLKRVIQSGTRLLDCGANTGEYSLKAAALGASVVAIERDEQACELLYRAASAARADVLPLNVDLARPTPPVGWRNAEQSGFLERATGKGGFDAVLMLALIHHMLVESQIPLADILGLAAELTNRWLLIEYVDPADPMFRALARGRDALYRDLTREAFEHAFEAAGFEAANSAAVSNGLRHLYLLRRRTSS